MRRSDLPIDLQDIELARQIVRRDPSFHEKPHNLHEGAEAPARTLGLLLLYGDDGVSDGTYAQSASRVLCPPNQWASYFDASTLSGCTESRLVAQASVSARRYQSVRDSVRDKLK